MDYWNKKTLQERTNGTNKISKKGKRVLMMIRWFLFQYTLFFSLTLFFYFTKTITTDQNSGSPCWASFFFFYNQFLLPISSSHTRIITSALPLDLQEERKRKKKCNFEFCIFFFSHSNSNHKSGHRRNVFMITVMI